MAAVRPLVVKAGRVRMLPASDSLDWSWLSGIPAQLALWAGIAPITKADTFHGHVVSDVTGLQAALDAKVAATRTVTAGNGLTGGGSLEANRTLTLGTPGSITGATTNAVTGTSHTHAISIGTADVTGLTAALSALDTAVAARVTADAPTFNSGYFRIHPYNAAHTVSGGYMESYFSENSPAAGANWRLMARNGAGAIIDLNLNVAGGVTATGEMYSTGDIVSQAQVRGSTVASLGGITAASEVTTTGTGFRILDSANAIRGRLQHNGTNLYVASDVGDLYLRPAGFGSFTNQLWLQAGAATTEPGIVGSGNIHVAKGNAFISVGAAADHVGGGIANFNSVGNQPQLGVFAGNGSGNAGMIYLRPDGRASAVGQSTFSTTAANIGTAVNVTGWVKATVDMEVSGADVGFKAMPSTGRRVKFGSNNSNNSGIYNVTDAAWMLRWNASNVADLYGTQFRLVSSGSEFYRARANSASMDRQPRIFIQSADPGAAAAPGDLWGW